MPSVDHQVLLASDPDLLEGSSLGIEPYETLWPLYGPSLPACRCKALGRAQASQLQALFSGCAARLTLFLSSLALAGFA